MEKKKVCKKCRYAWIPRTNEPKQCPLCKQYQIKKKDIK